MVEYAPLALACGHLVAGFATFETQDDGPTLVECPEGCGLVEFVIEPTDG